MELPSIPGKKCQILEEFKNRIKHFKPIHCTCTVCQRRYNYLFNLLLYSYSFNQL